MSGLRFKLKMSRQILIQIIGSVLVMLVLVTGCTLRSTDDRLLQYFDQSTGATVTRLAAPVAFYREEPMLAANARDYVYIGPAELNRSGDRTFVLWMDFCSTIDRAGGPGVYAPERVFLMLDGKPMEMSPERIRMGINQWSYVSPVVGGSITVYRVTRAQLRLLATAGDVRVLAENNGVTQEYAWWRGADTGFEQFSGYLENESQYLVTLIDE
jgi:hypothetical protein